MSYEDVGQGSAVVLLHAGVGDRRMWAEQIETLRRSHRVVAPDLRGNGDTPLPGERFAYSDDVLGLLDYLGIESASLVGASFGGRVALEVASVAPERVSRLVLLAPGFAGLAETASAAKFDEQEQALLEAGDVEAAVELNVRTWLGPEADDKARELVRQMQRNAFEVGIAAEGLDPAPALDKVDVYPSTLAMPALIVSGAHDVDHFQAVAAHLSSHMRDAEVVNLPWAGHLPSLERPQETAAVVDDFLRRSLPKLP